MAQNIIRCNELETTLINGEPYPPTGEGITITDQSSSSSTFYPVFFDNLTGTTSTLSTSNSFSVVPSESKVISDTIQAAAGDLSLASKTKVNVVSSNVIQYSLPIAPPTAIDQALVSTGSGPGSVITWQTLSAEVSAFQPPNVCYVSSIVGNDANPGTLAQPVATLTHALTLISANGVIECPDCSSFSELISIGTIFLNAPYASLTGNNISTPLITVNGNCVVNMRFLRNYGGGGGVAVNSALISGAPPEFNIYTLYDSNTNFVNYSTANAILNCCTCPYISNAGTGSIVTTCIFPPSTQTGTINCPWAYTLTPALLAMKTEPGEDIEIVEAPDNL
jgi:hypothetical protein